MNDDVDIYHLDIQCAYYYIDDLDNSIVGNNELLIVTHNITSFNRNYEGLSLALANIGSRIDVIILTETWFMDGLCGEIDGFTGFHAVRSDRIGGGVSVYVRFSLQSIFLADYSQAADYGEICAVEILPDKNSKSNKCIIFGIYRPPHCALLPSFTERLENMLLGIGDVSVTLCGDFNVDLLTENENSNFFNMLYSVNFLPVVNIATRITENSATCIDQI